MMRLAGRPRVMAAIGEPIWVMNPICFDARAAKAVRACIVTGNNSSPRSRNIPFFQVTYNGNQVALFVGTPIWTGAGDSAWAPYGKQNRKMITADRLIIRFNRGRRKFTWNESPILQAFSSFPFHVSRLIVKAKMAQIRIRAVTFRDFVKLALKRGHCIPLGNSRTTDGGRRLTIRTTRLASPRHFRSADEPTQQFT